MHLGKERVDLAYISTSLFFKGHQDRNSDRTGPGVEAMEGATSWLAQPAFYKPQNLQPRDGLTHNGLGPISQ